MSQERDRHSSRSSSHHEFLIKLRGIPYKSTKDDVKKFLQPCHVTAVHLFSENGNSSGECLVDLESQDDVDDALGKNKQFMGKRYIEVFPSSTDEYSFFVKHNGMVSWRDPVVRLSGLPCTCTMADIQNFFTDVTIAVNGIYITRDMSDNAVSGGFVAFTNMGQAYRAMDMYNQKTIEQSRIDLTPSTYDEAKRVITGDAHLNGKRFAGEASNEESQTGVVQEIRSRPTRREPRSDSLGKAQIDYPPRPLKRRRSTSSGRDEPVRPIPRDKPRQRDRSRSPIRFPVPKSSHREEHLIKMCGMPYTILERDIQKFFPSSCQPVHIELLLDSRTNRPNGNANVLFSSRDKAREAMKCDRNYMGTRYVELYLKSSDPSPPKDRRNPSHGDHSEARSRSKSERHTNGYNHSRSSFRAERDG